MNNTRLSSIFIRVCVSPCTHLHIRPPPPLSVFISHTEPVYIVKMPTADKRPQAHAGVGRSPPYSPSPLLLPSLPPPLCAPLCSLLPCVVDTSWHVAKSPDHLSALLSCPLFSAALTTLLCGKGRGGGRGGFVASLSLLQVPYSERQEPASQPDRVASLVLRTL